MSESWVEQGPASGQHAILEKILDANNEVIYELDVQNQKMRWFGDLTKFFGADEPTRIENATAFISQIAETDRGHRLDALHQHLMNGDAFICRYKFNRFDYGYEWLEESGIAEMDADGDPLKIVGRLKQVTLDELQRREMESRVCQDELTGLMNKETLSKNTATLLKDAAQTGSRIGILIMEIENLGLIKHSYGSDVGDQVIGWLAHKLDELFGKDTLIGRIDSSKFALVLQDVFRFTLRDTAQSLLRLVDDAVIDTHLGPIKTGLRIGGLVAPDEASDVTAALGRAEEALEESKRPGRGHFVEFKLQRHQARAGRDSLAVAQEVLKAITQKRLKLAFQPIVCADTGIPEHYESLVRMIRSDGRLVNPGRFMPALEESGHVKGLDAYTVKSVIEHLRRHPHAHLAVNVSGCTVTDNDAVQSLLDQIEAAEDVRGRLTLEITETVAVDDIRLTDRFVKTVRAFGCKVSLDDFGSGYTSFQQLKMLEVDTVKIDAEFISGIVDSRKNQQLVRAMVDTCHAFDFEIVAEGIGNQAEAELIKSLGVHYLQGYFFGKPEFGILDQNIDQPLHWHRVENVVPLKTAELSHIPA